MNKGSILKITSTRGNGLGTGFVIDSYDKGIVVATCSHVVSMCNSDGLLVEGYVAIVKNDYKDLGLDLAILIVEGLKREVLTVELSSPKKVKVVGYSQFNTKIRNNIKIETMKSIDAEYDIVLFGEGEEINKIRLSSKHKISSGYSGSPVICEETGVVIGMVVLEVSGNSNDSYTNYAISSKHILEKYDFSNQVEQKSKLVENISLDILNRKNKDEIIETILLDNGESFDIELVKVELEANKILYVGKYPVTFDEYDFYDNSIEDKRGRNNYPIINVDWNNSNLYCKWLTKNSKDSNILFRLPTPQEWESIAKQNFPSKSFIFSSIHQVKEVKKMEKGELGIYGMYGNVHEWCYSKEGKEPKIVKGGSFRNSLKYISDVTNITDFFSEDRNDEISFRIVAEKPYNKNIKGG